MVFSGAAIFAFLFLDLGRQHTLHKHTHTRKARALVQSAVLRKQVNDSNNNSNAMYKFLRKGEGMYSDALALSFPS